MLYWIMFRSPHSCYFLIMNSSRGRGCGSQLYQMSNFKGAKDLREWQTWGQEENLDILNILERPIITHQEIEKLIWRLISNFNNYRITSLYIKLLKDKSILLSSSEFKHLTIEWKIYIYG